MRILAADDDPQCLRLLSNNLKLKGYQVLTARDVQAKTILGDLVLDDAQCLVTVGGREIELSPIEYHLLAILARRAGRVVTQEVLLASVWDKGYTGKSHLLQVAINRLRRRLEPDPDHPRYLLTRIGVGYLLTNTG